MNYEWDNAKAESNYAKHGVHFSAIDGFDWESVLVVDDHRAEYDELRYRALGLIDSRLYALAFTVRDIRIRLISLRKANRREVKFYESQIS